MKIINLNRTNVDYIIKKFFPSGSGFDCNYEVKDTKNVDTEKVLYIQSSYHCLNGHGYYDGYQDFTIGINKRWIDGDFTLRFNGNRYKAEKYVLRDYMEDTLYHHFSELFLKYGKEISE